MSAQIAFKGFILSIKLKIKLYGYVQMLISPWPMPAIKTQHFKFMRLPLLGSSNVRKVVSSTGALVSQTISRMIISKLLRFETSSRVNTTSC